MSTKKISKSKTTKNATSAKPAKATKAKKAKVPKEKKLSAIDAAAQVAFLVNGRQGRTVGHRSGHSAAPRAKEVSVVSRRGPVSAGRKSAKPWRGSGNGRGSSR
jgi:hypothetical protein